MEDKEVALDTADWKSTKRVRYVHEKLWFGPVDQQDYNNIIPTASDLPLSAQVNSTFPFLAMNMHRKPSHTECYLHFKFNHSHNVKREAFHNLDSRV